MIFLLVTPAEQPDLQVLLLSQIARVAGDPENLRELRQASTATEVGRVLAGSDSETAAIRLTSAS
jgi:mannitol/fructose-specific phosphotransferase system IIA component (Ntr-type)